MYNRTAGRQKTFFVEATEQDIMDWELLANRNGHIACTHGGESLAGLVQAKKKGYVDTNDIAILDSTAHAIKFSGFQDMYFENTFPAEFEVIPQASLVNAPIYVRPKELKKIPAPGAPLQGDELKAFVDRVSEAIAVRLNLKKG